MRHKSRDRWHCHACNKTAFGSESRALETLEVISLVTAGQPKHIPVRAYECPYNPGSWHLTSKEY